jgi:hypothetical protein
MNIRLRRSLIGMLLIACGCGGSGQPTGTAGSGGGAAGSGGGAAGAAAGSSGGGTAGATAGSSGGGIAGGPAGSSGGGIAGGPAGSSGGGTAGSAGGTAGAAGGAAGRGGAGGGTAGAAGGGAGRGGAGGGAGAAGAGGRGGSGGAPPVGTNQSVYERNKNPSKDAHFIQPGLTRAAAAGMVPTPGFTATFTGSMWASPLYMENGPGGTGAFFAVTTGNDVVALDETTGAMKWTRNIGTSPQNSGAGCGSIHPIGILSTPVIDPTSRTIYVAGAIGNQTTIQRHEVHALNVEDGVSRSGWPVNVSNMASGGFTFDPPSANQRSALSLVNGILYVSYGGHVGDCGPYHGWVMGITAANPVMRGGWVTGGQGEGIWHAGGTASDGNGVIAITGNRNPFGQTPQPPHLDSEEVVRITGMGMRADAYWPASWAQMDAQDADFGSSNPMVVQLPGATPSNIVVAISKDGYLHLLDAANFGGEAGHRVRFKMTSQTSAMQIRTSPAAYRTAMGLYVVLTIDSGMPNCPSGGSGKQVVAVRIAPGSPPVPTIAWCAGQSGTESTGPIATTTDGMSESIVWYMAGNQLRGVNGDTGAAVYSGTSTCGGLTRRWSQPIAVKNRIITNADGRLCSWSLP